MGIEQRRRERQKRMVAHMAHGHEEAEQWDLEFWQSLTPQDRLSALVAIHRDIEKVQASRNGGKGEE